jgi:predicted ArsR family transcriptional regulator
LTGNKRSIFVITCDILTRREIEARIVAPLLEAFTAEVGRERAIEIVRQVILQIAREQGAQLAQQAGGCTLAHFAAALEAWRKGDAMEMEVLEQSEQRLAYNVTRCGYADMYRQLGIAELGKTLSCGRDFALIEGFNPQIRLTRTQTILEGAPHCDFRYELK